MLRRAWRAVLPVIFVLVSAGVGPFLLAGEKSATPPPPTKEQIARWQAATKKWDDFHAALRQKKAAKLVMTADELTAVCENLPELHYTPDGKPVYSQFFFEDNKVLLKIVISLDGLPGFKGKAFGGVVTFVPRFRDGKISLDIDSVKIVDKETPRSIERFLDTPQFLSFLQDHSPLGAWLKGLSFLEVKNDKLIMKANGV